MSRAPHQWLVWPPRAAWQQAQKSASASLEQGQGCAWSSRAASGGGSHGLRQAALGEGLWIAFPSPRLSCPICKWKGQVTWSPSSAVPACGPSWPSLLPTLGSQSHLVVTASVLCRPRQGLLLGVPFCGSATWAACFCQWDKIEENGPLYASCAFSFLQVGT